MVSKLSAAIRATDKAPTRLRREAHHETGIFLMRRSAFFLMRRSARRAAGLTLAILLLGTGLQAAPAAAHPAMPKQDSVIVLPGATSTEGIARGAGSTFYAGDLFAGDIYRGDIRKGTAALFIDAPAGRMALGMKADIAHHLLFVAGGFTG